jgi:hypothetical protein
MALPILDGNQTSTTLSTTFSDGEHIPAHTIVSLGEQAIADIATAVGGSSVTITGGVYLSDAQVVLGGNAPAEAVQIGGYNLADNKLYPIAVDNNGVQSVSGTVTASAQSILDGLNLFASNYNDKMPVAADISSMPAISGTVTANAQFPIGGESFVVENGGIAGERGVQIAVLESNNTEPFIVGDAHPLPISGTVTANCRSDIYDGVNDVYFNKSIIAWGNPFLGEPSFVEQSAPLPISGTVTANTYTGQFVRVITTGNVGGEWLLERVSETFWKNRDDANEGATISYLPNSYIWEFQSGEGAVAWNGNAFNSIPPSDGWQGLVDIATITVTPENPYPISGTVTANVNFASATATPPSNAVNIGFQNGDGEFLQVGDQYPLPVSSYDQKLVSCSNGNSGSEIPYSVSNIRIVGGFVSTSVTIPSSNIFKAILLDASGRTVVTGSVSVSNSVTISALPVSLSTTTIGGTARLNVTLSSATTIGATAPSYGNLYGGSDGTNLRAILVDSSGRTTVTGSVNILGTPSVTFSAIAGTVTANNPNGTLTTRFGSVVTANSVLATTCVTNASRKYLLIQNNQTGTSAGTVTIGIGFTPTTTQGIQLISGASYTADSFVPTGAVYWLGSVTGATFTILEG